jgi:hypothetical protein
MYSLIWSDQPTAEALQAFQVGPANDPEKRQHAVAGTAATSAVIAALRSMQCSTSSKDQLHALHPGT